MNLFNELIERGLLEKTTSDDLEEKLNAGGMTFYIGFDPTSDSLHIGNFALLNLMRLLQRHGHFPIGLMGGATGMIGDPGGKSVERNLLTKEQLEFNIAGITVQLAKFLEFESGNKAIIVNNYLWFEKWAYLDFLREVGKHFSVNAMINRDSVKNRLEREGEGISYTEFSYMLLQAYDYYYLNVNYDCTLQIGGSDQWGNIVSGIDFTRRKSGKKTYGFTVPLITKSDGTKFGKSESGAVFLDPKKTSPYEFYQFFIRQTDEDVIRFLKVFTQLELDEIAVYAEKLTNEPHKREAQKKLAEEVTRTVHGQALLDKVLKASAVLFGGKVEDLDDATIAEIFKDVPSINIDKQQLIEGWPLIDALVEIGACNSKGQARKLIHAGGVYVNNEPQKDVNLVLTIHSLASYSYLIIRKGKKDYYLVHIGETTSR